MELIHRVLESKLWNLAEKFPFVTLTGPRQSGKSTLAAMTFPDYAKVSLEDLDMRQYATEDPRGFISTYPAKAIIDEVQRVPSILSYLQTHSDSLDKEGLYILTGSQNFRLMKAIDQSLAGRTAILTLLPLSLEEMRDARICPATTDEAIFKGGYPRVYAKDIDPTDFYPSYINTYVERDIHQSLAVGNLDKFVKFLKLCAGRIGQLFNKSSLAVEVGVSVPTIDSWISVLQASFIVYLLPPYHQNFSKRLTKSPKLYFYDTGVACSLLGVQSAEQLRTHYLRGGLFENLVINEFVKHYCNRGITPDLTFWRDSSGNEIDLIDCSSGTPVAYEIKSGETYSPTFFKGLQFWAKLTNAAPEHLNVIYDGSTQMTVAQGNVLPFCKFKVRL